MHITCISDLHGNTNLKIEPTDILVIAGDLCGHYYERYVGDFSDCFGQAKWLQSTFSRWLDAVPAKEKVLIFGNHDWVAETNPDLVPTLNAHVLGFKGIHTVTILGVKIFGDPYSPYFHGWAFNSPPGNEGGEEFLDKIYSKIEEGTDIVITHGPPLGLGDLAPDNRRTGSASLLKHLKRVQPKLSVHGHIHCGYGKYKIEHEGNTTKETVVVNASVLNEKYNLVNAPICVEI